MAKIVRVEILQVDLVPKAVRTDAIQSFAVQETPMVRIHTSDGIVGTGYSYTIGTGGSSVVALLRDHLAPRLLGRDPLDIEAIWKSLFFSTHATAVGAITSLALSAIDTALWDVKCLAAGRPLWKEAGGAQPSVPVYSTEGGWLHVEPQALVDDALSVRAQGFGGAKIKVGRPHVSEDIARLTAVRDAVGPGFEIMVDANQAFTVGEARNRCPPKTSADIFASQHRRRCRSRSASPSIIPAISGNICSATPARSFRPMWRGSAASRRGSRWRTSPKPSTFRSARIS